MQSSCLNLKLDVTAKAGPPSPHHHGSPLGFCFASSNPSVVSIRYGTSRLGLPEILLLAYFHS